MVTPQQEVGESVRCLTWTDTTADIIINYSWHLSLPRGAWRDPETMPGCTQELEPWSPRESEEESPSCIQPKRLSGKEIPGIPLSLLLPRSGGRQVTLQLITKLERLWVSMSSSQTTKR
ncbi:unnamed protein product [Xyrichtys novacula]|uniref:Unnamed protein product n=1 Tax=Xyrichtys novacula TaxID=13765 RepID=A0AAV1G6S3_XYRNO|nr:unnamed protein product [Xyrichtys novacula]